MSYNSKRTGAQVEAQLDKIDGKQDKLVSGTNIKTVNGLSILGSGNIDISGSGSGGGDNNTAVRVMIFAEPLTLDPNTVTVIVQPTDALNIEAFNLPSYNEDLDVEEQGGCFYAEYTVVFYTSVADIPISLPGEVVWANGIIPNIERDVEYELSVSFRGNAPLDGTFKAVLTPFKAV